MNDTDTGTPEPGEGEAGKDGPDRPRRTLTPSVWLDALLGLPAGFILFYSVGHLVQALTPDPTPGTQVMQAYASLGIIGAACAPVCFMLGHRFPVLAVVTALGVAPTRPGLRRGRPPCLPFPVPALDLAS